MNTFPKSQPQRGLLLALAALLFFPLAATAQDRPDRGERLKQTLDLTDTQVALVDQAVGDEAERGNLWDISAALAPTLTDKQKEKLFARPERPERGRSGEARDKQRGERSESDHADRRDAAHEEMKDALGLTDAQVEQLEALHAEHQAEREARSAERPERGALSDDLAVVLTPQQLEVAKVHHALAMHLHRGHGQGRRHDGDRRPRQRHR